VSGAAARPRLVVLRALGLGDLLTAVPALRGLRGGFPDHEIVLTLPAALAPLADLLDDAVDTVVDVDFRQAVGALPAELGEPDVAVNLHGRGPQSHAALAALGPRRLLAFADPDHAPDGPAWDDEEHERRRWCRLLAHHGIAADPGDLLLAPPVRHAGDIDVGRFAGATVIHPGAASAARRWPADRWAAVARHERTQGRDVVVTGGPDEDGLADAVARFAGVDAANVLAGRTSIVELATLVAVAGRVICGDTGVAHLASAFATPSAVLFGPTPPARWGPPGNGRHVALWAGREGDPHGDAPDPGLLSLEIDVVTAALDGLPDHSVTDLRADPTPT
jgi:ADP-heptose:LPS heptosyltransferase